MRSLLPIAAALIPLLLILGACSTPDRPDLTIDPNAAYEGPPVTSSVVEGQHVVTVTVPTGGWDLIGEHLDRRFRDTRLYLTLVRPDPEMMHTQALMEFDVTPDVPAEEPLAVYVRVVDFGADPNDARFRLAKAIDPRRD